MGKLLKQYINGEWVSVVTGEPGATGPQGDPGGATGPQGATGLTGATGPQGADSTVPGATGATGPTGPQGIQGTQGSTGPIGPRGTTAWQYNFSTSTANANPGTGVLRFNNSNPTSITQMYINHTGTGGLAIGQELGRLANVVGSVKGTLFVADNDNGDTVNAQIANVITQSGWSVLTLNSSQGVLPANSDDVSVLIIQSGSSVTGATGSTGVQGATGPQGIQGTTGLTGATGSTGPQGTQGIQGVEGPIGATGLTGATGPAGATGSAGVSITMKGTVAAVIDLPSTGNAVNDAYIVTADGDLYVWDGAVWNSVGQIIGPEGPAGATGAQGSAGATGATGPQGVQGIQGTQGDQGATGPQGSAGPTGATGVAGTNGTDGATGATGIQGATGPAGTNGTNGTNGTDGATGATGPQGPAGNDGAVGATGITGATGPAGSNGTNGTDGATGATGPAGSAGAVGATGASGVGVPVGGTTGQVLAKIDGTDYNTQWVTGGGGGGSPGGANTQIQFNDGGAFAGNAAMTFSNTTGNISFGNLVIGNTGTTGTHYNVITSKNAFVGNTTVSPSPARVLIGNGRNGDWSASTNADPFNNGRNTRVMVSDAIIKTDNGLRNGSINGTLFVDLNAGNIGTANVNSRVQGISSDLIVFNGNSLQNSPFAIRGASFNSQLGNFGGGSNATAVCMSGVNTVAAVNQGSRANSVVGTATQIQNVYGNTTFFGNIVNAIGYTSSFGLNNGGNAAVYLPQNVVGYYVPGTTNRFGLQASNIAPHRVCANYYAFLNDDPIAFSGLGSLRAFHEFQATDTISSGVLAVNKNDGQVQYVDVTENITSVTFSNFVTRVTAEQGGPAARTTNQTDTVTLILRQDSTGRSITMPTGTGYRYSGGTNTVGTTPNSITMVSVTGIWNATLAATEYLITISPEFV